uniref:Podoplanin n=1 Tax=Myotis lucifugus TaxID=59463 RepID=G1PVU8_MYOLU
TDTPIEDLPTTESTGHAQEDTQSTTALNGATSHPRGKKTALCGSFRTRYGFSTGTLIGIIVGVLLGIGFIAGIIIVAVRKMSGRYS